MAKEYVIAFQVGDTVLESRTYQAGDVFGDLPSEKGVYHWYLGNGEKILPTTKVPAKNTTVWGSTFALRITQPIALNVSTDNIVPVLHMVQGDSNSRTIAATLWNGASPFTPSGTAMLRFRKPDGTGGLYDKSEGGESITTFGNGVSIPVAAQMLAVEGTVYCELNFYAGGTGIKASRLATFRFLVDVEASTYPDAQIISSDYYNILTSDITNAQTAAANAQKSAAAAAKSASSAATSVEGAVKYNTPQTLSDAQKQQARDNIGAPAPYTAGENISISGSVIATKAFPCNPNLLDNWYFGNSVNQRGQTSYTGAGYGIDRWKAAATTPNVTTIKDGYIELLQNGLIEQTLEEPYSLCERQVTASALLTTGLYTFTTTVPSKEELSAITTDTLLKSAYFSVGGNNIGYIYLMHTKMHNTVLRLRAFEGFTVGVIASKLELGVQQTLAHQENDVWVLNEIPKFGEQLAACQRHLIPLSSYQCPAARLGVNEILFFVPLPVTMRTLPIINQNGFQVLSKTGETQTGFTFSVSSLRSNGVIISASKTGHGMTDAVLSAGTLSLLSAEL